MKVDRGLKELERQFSLCIKCKQCTYGSWPKNLPVCPINDKYKFFTYSAGGILYLARAMLLGLIEPADYDEVLKIVSRCTSCGYCGEICKLVKAGPPHENVTELIKLLKINLVKNGVYQSEKHKQVIDRIKERKRLFFSSSKGKKLGMLKREVPNKGKTLVFLGCISSYKQEEIVGSVIEILNKAEIAYQIMDDEWCCGAPLLDLGDINGISEFAEYHLETIRKMGIDEVLFLCPHCQDMFKNVYPQVTGRELDFELISITKYLRGIIDSNQLKPSKALSYKVSYHDPCYLGRYAGDFDSPRAILDKIPMLDFVEMERNREESYCCGAGGGAWVLDSDNAVAIGQERINEFEKTGMDLLVTACPLCKDQFCGLNMSGNKKIVVKDVVEVLKESLD